MAYATLTVDLTAKLTNLQAGMNQAVAVAQQASGRMQAAFAGVTTAFAALGAAGVLAGLTQGLANAVNELADLDDAAEQTGASVESLSSTLNTLAPTGVGLADVVDVASRLTRAMQGAGEDTGKAAEAFKALGIATRDAAGLRPVEEVLDDLAKSLARYEDGTRKTAIAQAIFGKAGAEVLPLLKDLATRTRESSTVTGEQAAQAERLANGWRTLGVEATRLRQAIASELIPTLADLVEQFNATGRAGGGMWDRIRGALGPNKALRDLESDLAGLTDQRSVAERLGFSAEALADFDARIAAIRARIQSLQPALRIANGPTVREQIFGGAAYGPLPALPQAPAISGAAAGLGDLARAYDELDAKVRQADLDDQLREQAAALDAATAAGRAYQDMITSLAPDERAGAGAALAPDVAGWERVAALLREIRGIDTASKSRDAALDAANRLLDAGGISFAEYERLGAAILGLSDPIAKVAEQSRSIFAPIESAFEKALFDGERLSKVLGSLAEDVARTLVRSQLTAPAAEYLGSLFGGGTKGSTLFDGLLGLFGGKREAGGPVWPGSAFLVGERGPEVFVPSARGTIVPNHAIGAPVTHIYNIDSRTDRSVIVADIQRAQLAALGAQRDARERGNEAYS